MNSELQTQLEVSVQRAIDGILKDDTYTQAAMLVARSQAFASVSPSLSVWLNSVLLDYGRRNEDLIDLAAWSDIDIACGLSASLALDNVQTEAPQISELSRALLVAFAHAAAHRLKVLSIGKIADGAA